MGGIEEKLNNIINKDILQLHLTQIALFIGAYENFIDVIEERVESFLCDSCFLDESKELKWKKSEKYKSLIEKRRVDDMGNKNPLKATMLWFVDEGAITNEDYELFLRIKNLRDRYVHKMSDSLWNGLYEDDADMLFSMMELYNKVDKWWINEIEIPIAGDEIPDGYDTEGVASFSYIAFQIMIGVLYGGKSEEYIDILKSSSNYQEKT